MPDRDVLTVTAPLAFSNTGMLTRLPIDPLVTFPHTCSPVWPLVCPLFRTHIVVLLVPPCTSNINHTHVFARLASITTEYHVVEVGNV